MWQIDSTTGVRKVLRVRTLSSPSRPSRIGFYLILRIPSLYFIPESPLLRLSSRFPNRRCGAMRASLLQGSTKYISSLQVQHHPINHLKGNGQRQRTKEFVRSLAWERGRRLYRSELTCGGICVRIHWEANDQVTGWVGLTPMRYQKLSQKRQISVISCHSSEQAPRSSCQRCA